VLGLGGVTRYICCMTTGIVISYSDDTRNTRAEVALRNGEHILLKLDRNGVTIMRLTGPGHCPEILFQADPNLATRMCDGLFALETTPKPPPLRILVAAVVQLGSADEVGTAFQRVAAQVS
jgi:hypothetical protein